MKKSAYPVGSFVSLAVRRTRVAERRDKKLGVTYRL